MLQSRTQHRDLIQEEQITSDEWVGRQHSTLSLGESLGRNDSDSLIQRHRSRRTHEMLKSHLSTLIKPSMLANGD
jgi:hypothetical protein